jgi:hypothetical protein
LFQRLLTPMAEPLANFSSRLTVRGIASLEEIGPGTELPFAQNSQRRLTA